jgi:putative N6-adenine-specific DNA methylase
MVIASGWDGRTPLLDPMCGSGTIAIEAALLARRIAPGAHRSFAFERWANYEPELWHNLVQITEERAFSGEIGAILASDRDDGVVKAAEANAQRAGVKSDIRLQVRPISAIELPSEPGCIVTNPPYGTRVGERGRLRNLYAQLGNVLKAKARGYSLSLLSADRTLERMLRVPLQEVFHTRNGGIPVRFMTGTIA